MGVGRTFGGCCGNDNPCDPFVFARKPSLSVNYDEVLANSIKVYILKGVYSKPDGIKISMGNLRGVPTLGVEGTITY